MTARLTRRPGAAARLRALLESGQTIVAPGAFDPLAARLVEEAGFPAVYMTGFGTSAALIGRPDVGLLTMTEMAGNAGRIAACVDIPVIADADTGYGNPLNVIRTVGAYEAAGVAGIHIEDQVAPEEVRPHGGQAGHRCAGDGREGARRRRGPRPARVRDHRQDRRAARSRASSALRPRAGVPRRRGRRPVHRGGGVRGGGRGSGAGVPRRAAAVQLGRGRQDPADRPEPARPSSATGSSSSRSARCWRPPPPCAGSCGRSPGRNAGRGHGRASVVRRVP